MKTLLDFIRPTAGGVMLNVFLAISILIASSFELILSLLAGDQTGSESLLEALSTDFTRSLDILSSFSGSATITTFLVWLGIGSIVYLIVIGVSSFFSEAGFSFIEEWKFVHPRNYHQGDYLKDFLLRSGLHLAVLVMLVAYTIVLIQALWPTWVSLFVGFLSEPISLNGLYGLVVSVLGFIVSLHILTILLRALFLRRRLFGNV